MADASHPKTGASHKRVGSVVRGKYRVDGFVATGTMANVYSATHRNGARVALKILHPQLSEDPSLTERFKREGYFANSIGHPGIVRAIDDDVTEDGCAFIVMELLEGESLDERRRRKGGKLALSYVLPVADALLEVLAAAHGKGVVHRDLKPDNVFVTKTGEVKVLDFGLARFADGKDSSDMTAVGMVLGTPAYMPPEQALGRREDVDAQSDLWAVGATLFVVLSGESVHIGGDAKAKLIATARTAARPLREAAPEVPRAVAAVIDRALAFHKKERWADAEAMREALRWARMSALDQPSQGVTSSQAYVDPGIPSPAPTRRGMEDDEPTVARLFRSSDSEPAPPLSETAIEMSSASRDFLTSAPPITQRDARAAGAKRQPSDPAASSPVPSNNEPVFSLRRGKEGEQSPSTERIPGATDAGATGETRAGDNAETSDNAGTVEVSESVPHARVMPVYDPADTMGGSEPPSSSEALSRSVEVNFSFTRPMAAMVMPEGYEAPRPAAGQPPSPSVTTLPGFPPAPNQPQQLSAPQQGSFGTPSSPPPNYSSSPPPPPIGGVGGVAGGSPMESTMIMGGAVGLGSFPPPQLRPSSAPGQHQMATAPSLRVQAELAQTQLAMQPPHAHPSQNGALAAAGSRPSLPPESPGPLLSSIVKPRFGALRVVVPVVLGIVALAIVFVVLRTRAANARAAAPVAITSAPPPPASSPAAAVAVGNLPTAPAEPAPPAAASPAAPPVAMPVGRLPDDPNPAVVAAAPTASEVKEKPKKPRRPRRPKPPPAAAAEATADPPAGADPAPTPTPTPTTTMAPATTTDPPAKDSLPNKDPE